MDRPDLELRRTIGRMANGEARRRATAVGKVAAVVIITVLATLVFSGHRLAPECVRAVVCLERPDH